MRKPEDFEGKSGNSCLGNTYANMNDLKAQMSGNNPEAKAVKNTQDRLTLVLIIFLILVFLILVIFTSLLFVYLKECTSQFENKLEQHKNETKPSCESGWLEFDGHCYFFSHFQLSWTSAQMMCLNRGSYLVIITSQEEQEFLNQHINKKTYWIGLTDEKTEGTFQWVDGTLLNSPPSYQFWNNKEPNDYEKKEDCAELSIAEKWNDSPCDKIQFAICEKRPI
ncbi:CD209 antigen-like protein D isoform X2 [Rana temporaria]|uniref:CD209 antigen-like protein D isoform X2 n=1 Tax=Rana temporaria TaxID=8407 RepID=UPI001AAC6EEF|nr:CD209 antigen-like protein D isoform X2 [Rana temporaria]